MSRLQCHYLGSRTVIAINFWVGTAIAHIGDKRWQLAGGARAIGANPPSSAMLEQGGPAMSDQQNEPLHTWELVDKKDETYFTFRMAVPGGWLYRYTDGHSLCMTFVPKPSARTPTRGNTTTVEPLRL
jgi:hypothetical protein